MIGSRIESVEQRATTPRAAAIAGILFAILFSLSVVLIRLSLPSLDSGNAAWVESAGKRVSLALGLMPFAGIAFLWFVGVARDRLGAFEDQFFSTVFFGSGLLFLAMTFAAAAIAGGIVAVYATEGSQALRLGVLVFGRTLMSHIFNVYALKMAGVFMLSLGTLWLRTGVMPRLMSFITYVVAIAMLLIVSLNPWIVLTFPAWVFTVSIYILVLNYRRKTAKTMDGMTAA